MRYREIIEAAATTTPAQQEAERKRKANQKLADANRKRSDAGQRYQAQLRQADQAQQTARAALQKKS